MDKIEDNRITYGNVCVSRSTLKESISRGQDYLSIMRINPQRKIKIIDGSTPCF